MCREAGQYIPGDPRKPLHQCDIYRQPAAGNMLKWVEIYLNLVICIFLLDIIIIVIIIIWVV